MGILSWEFDFDWDGDETYESDEADYVVDFYCRRGREYYLYEDGAGFNRQLTGKAYITLDNSDGRFDPFNTGSAIYPNVEPGKFARVRVTEVAGSTDPYDVFAGKIADIKPVSGGQDHVRIILHDGWQWLRDQTVNVAISTGVAFDDIAPDVLSDVDWPTIWGSDIGAGVDTYGYWWADDISAAKALADVAEAELGYLTVMADGSLQFRSRHRADTAIQNIDQSEMLREINTLMPWESVRNIARVKVYPRVVQSSTDIWQLEDTPLIAAGATFEYWASFQYNNRPVPAINVITPTTDDFSANSQADGGGIDYTTDFTIDAPTVFGETAKVTGTNSGANSAYITLLKVRGDAVDAPNVTTLVEDNSGTDQPRTFTLDLIWQQDINNGVQFSLFLADFLSTVRAIPRFMLEDQPSKQFAVDLQDRVTLDIAKLGISSENYRVGYIEHQWTGPTGQAVRTTIYTEPHITFSNFYWIFPARIGETTVFAL